MVYPSNFNGVYGPQNFTGNQGVVYQGNFLVSPGVQVLSPQGAPNNWGGVHYVSIAPSGFVLGVDPSLRGVVPVPSYLCPSFVQTQHAVSPSLLGRVEQPGLYLNPLAGPSPLMPSDSLSCYGLPVPGRPSGSFPLTPFQCATPVALPLRAPHSPDFRQEFSQSLRDDGGDAQMPSSAASSHSNVWGYYDVISPHGFNDVGAKELVEHLEKNVYGLTRLLTSYQDTIFQVIASSSNPEKHEIFKQSLYLLLIQFDREVIRSILRHKNTQGENIVARLISNGEPELLLLLQNPGAYLPRESEKIQKRYQLVSDLYKECLRDVSVADLKKRLKTAAIFFPERVMVGAGPKQYHPVLVNVIEECVKLQERQSA